MSFEKQIRSNNLLQEYKKMEANMKEFGYLFWMQRINLPFGEKERLDIFKAIKIFKLNMQGSSWTNTVFPIRAQMVNTRMCNAETNTNFPAWRAARELIEFFPGRWVVWIYWKLKNEEKRFKSEIRDDCLLWRIRQNDLCDKFISLK